jgi:hypothetical protein
MTGQQPTMTSGENRVIQFRPRTLAKPPGPPPAAAQDNAMRGRLRQGPEDLSRVERTTEADDYRHRMMMNIAALAFTLMLTGLGVWLATTLADMRRTQDCLLVGRRDCARIPLPHGFPPRSAESI